MPRIGLQPSGRVTGQSLAGALLAGSSLTGCSLTPDHDFNDAGAPVPDDPGSGATGSPWALVLGSGGPRGFVHVGVLTALEEIGVRPPMIVGASVGALIGAMYASGRTARDIQEQALNLGITTFARLAVGSKERFSGSGIASFVNEQLSNAPMETLKTRFHAVALREGDRRPASFGKGNAGVAVQASCAIEGTFTPVTIRGVRYHDPDLVTAVPVQLAKALGAKKILSVDCSAHEDKAPESALRYREGDLLKRKLTQADVIHAEINLHPYFGYWINTSREFRLRAMDSGYKAAMEQAAEIKKLAATG